MAGLRYVASAISLPLFAILALFFVFGLIPLFQRSKRAHFLAATLAAMVLLASYLGFVVWVGGDFMPSYRFLMHVLPVVVGIGAIGLVIKPKQDGDASGDNSFTSALKNSWIRPFYCTFSTIKLAESKRTKVYEFCLGWRVEFA